MTQTISALYDNFGAASAAVSALERAGTSWSDISIVSSKSDESHGKDHESDAVVDAEAGAGIGAAVGGIGGLLTGLGLMAIPGVGPVVAAGWLASTAAGAVAGAAVGGATGGLIGALTDAGVEESDAHVYAEGIRRGGTLVTARVSDNEAHATRSILQQNKSVDIGSRGAAYRSSGWSAFDPAAPAYSADQVARERTRIM